MFWKNNNNSTFYFVYDVLVYSFINCFIISLIFVPRYFIDSFWSTTTSCSFEYKSYFSKDERAIIWKQHLYAAFRRAYGVAILNEGGIWRRAAATETGGIQPQLLIHPLVNVLRNSLPGTEAASISFQAYRVFDSLELVD